MTSADQAGFERALGLHRGGNIGAAVECYRDILRVEPQNPDALHYLGLAYLQLGDLVQAEVLLGRSLTIEPTRTNTICDLGTLKMTQKQFAAAIPLFTRALELSPNHVDALHNLAKTYGEMGYTAAALPLLERLTTVRPDAVGAFRQLGDTHYILGDIDGAIAAYRNALDLDPNDKLVRVSLGDAYESAGRFRPARMHYASVLRRDLDSPLALAGIIQLPNENIEPTWLERAHELAASVDTEPDARIKLNTALANYYDRHRKFPSAFQHIRAANDEKFAISPYDSLRSTVATDHLLRVFTKQYFESVLPNGVSSRCRPIFIVGMPRSGTTLTEQILASHPNVAAGGELSTLPNVVRRVQELSISKQPYPHGLKDLQADDRLLLANQYLSRLNQVSARASHVTDKLPFNFMHLGLIATLFPGASIIHCTRDPLDTCVSCYFTNFSKDIRFANNLVTLGRYYINYARLMKHWRSVLPMPMLEVPYESYVNDTENIVRRLLGFCGLEWDRACLAFYATRRGVQTPSRWQVRQPIYSSSTGRWKNYERELSPLMEILSQASSPRSPPP